MQLFDPKQAYTVIERRLPHWSQAGAVTFVTWRTWDSIPETVLRAWIAQRDAWLKQHGIDPRSPSWSEQVHQLDTKLVHEFQLQLSDRWNAHLDECHGTCVLRQPDLAATVAASLRHFNGDRYELTDFVVMPNHVHLLVAFPGEEAMLKQCESWKRYTATQINRKLARQGRFWQQDGFDHLVRSQAQFEYLRSYVADNPVRACLKPGEFIHESNSV